MVIDNLLLGKHLGRKKTKSLFQKLLKGDIDPAFAKQLLTLLQKKGECADELAGFVEAVRSIEKPIRYHHPNLVDGCGTGGDGKRTFNISTIASLVAASAGAKAAKHGNRSISSQCGSADLLEALGIKIDAPKNRMLKALKTTNFAYFHAPQYHSIFKSFQPIRACLAKKKIKTIFNFAGPLLNPARPKNQLIGVWRKDLLPVVSEAAKQLKLKRAMIVWNTAGYDELTTGQKTMIVELKNGKLKKQILSSRPFNLKPNSTSHLRGGAVKLNKKIALNIINGKDKSARLDTVVLNSAAILYVSGKTKNLAEGIRLSKKALLSGATARLVEKLKKVSHGS